MASILSDMLKREHNDGYVVPRVRKYLFERVREVERGELSRNQQRADHLVLEVQELTRVLEQFNSGNARDRTKRKFHPSQMHNCRRAVFFNMMGAPRDPAVSADDALRSHLIFSMGDSVHMRWQVLAQQAGIAKQIEVPVEHEVLDIEGHADGILEFEGDPVLKVWEIKSINTRGFKTVETEPKPEHVDQLRTYMFCLGLKEGIILYECKDNHAIKEYLVKEDEKVIEEFKSMILYLKRHFKKRRPPPKEGETPHANICRWCSFKRVCHNHNQLNQFTDKLDKDEGPKKSTKKKRKIRIGM